MKAIKPLIILLFSLFLAMPLYAATLLPPGEQQFSDQNGKPYIGGKLYFYIPNTNTFKPTWKDSNQTVPNTNPIILDGAGRAIIYGSGIYRQVLRDVNGNLIWDQLTSDVSAANTYSFAGTSGGSANAQTLNAVNFTSSDGQIVSFVAGFTNTGPMTLAPNLTNPITVLKDTTGGPVALSGGEVVTGNVVQAVYSTATGTFHLVSYPFDTRAPFVNIASAATTNIGTIKSQYINITGTNTISSFGASGDLNHPVYLIKFTGSLTLTNSVNLKLPGGANVITQANDYMQVNYLGTNNWEIFAYYRNSGKALIETQEVATQTGNANKFLTTNGTNTLWGMPDVPTARAAISYVGNPNVLLAENVNIASVTQSGTGVYNVVFVTPLTNSSYPAFYSDSTPGLVIIGKIINKTNGGFQLVTVLSNGVAQDFVNGQLLIFGARP